MKDDNELSVFAGKIAVSADEVAKACGISACTVYRAIDRGELEGFRFGKGKRAKRARVKDIPRWLRTCQTIA
jgi:excisionase family DNA binding protein